MTNAEPLDRREALVGAWLVEDLLIREATEQKAKIAAELASTLRAGEEIRLPNGQGVRLVSPARRFDPKLAMQRVPSEMLRLITTTEVSRELAQQKLSPAVYADCLQTKGDPYLRRL